ncbi:hypothetical protein PoB_000995800 [Plakobranchus ocellatus]|uniref:Uncharacterized protein n=1 Tax=Plakobranchus ocellatus TaxID=259542 RepID=A0AAV3YMH8_9GAST|nr:hypothetical protein PoB_000995800 [Plakobranchus ocellatus]
MDQWIHIMGMDQRIRVNGHRSVDTTSYHTDENVANVQTTSIRLPSIRDANVADLIFCSLTQSCEVLSGTIISQYAQRPAATFLSGVRVLVHHQSLV